MQWTRMLMRNFIPPAPTGPAGAKRRAALLASGSGAAGGLDWRSPNPFVVSRGGSATYNLVVWHLSPQALWVFDEPKVFW